MGHLLAEGVILGSVQWVEREEEECDSFFMSVGTSRDVDNIRNSQLPILIPYLAGKKVQVISTTQFLKMDTRTF